MHDVDANIGDPTEDRKLRNADDEQIEEWDPYWDIAQNEQIATPDGPMSREELEEVEDEGEVFTTEYRF